MSSTTIHLRSSLLSDLSLKSQTCCSTCLILNSLSPSQICSSYYVLPRLSLLILSLTLWVKKPPSLCLFSYHIYISASVFCRFYFRKASWVSCVCFMTTGIALVQLLINSHLEKSLIYSKKYLLSSYYVPVNILVTEAVFMNPINIKPMIYW